MKVLFPEIRTISVSKSLQLAVDSAQIDTLTFAIVSCRKQPSGARKEENRGVVEGAYGYRQTEADN